MTAREQAQMLLRKALADEALVKTVVQNNDVSSELVGYHCQQAVEKLLKAWLSNLGINYPKTHNLQALLELLEQGGQKLPEQMADIDRLTPYATIYRYEELPLEDWFDRAEAYESIRKIREFVEKEIGSP
jgi:HEPN domain-containing protein